MRFLVVDENDEMRRNVIRLLAYIGYTDVVEAADAARALFRFEKPMFVIVDGCIPNNESIQLVKALRCLEASQDAKILMILPDTLSSRTDGIRQTGEDLRVNGFLQRPLTTTVLREAIEPLLQ